MDVPEELLFDTIYKKGSVFYFANEDLSSDERHFHIVLNQSPSHDKLFILALPSSQIEKTLRQRRNAEKATLIQIKSEEYEGFTRDSIIDCNRVFSKTVDEIKEKHCSRKLTLLPKFPEELIEKIIQGVKKSKQITGSIKKLL